MDMRVLHRLGTLLFLSGALLFPRLSSAQKTPTLDDVRRDVQKLNIRLSYLKRTYKNLRLSTKGLIAEQILLGQEQFENKEYLAASIYLYEVVQNPKAQNHPFYLDAVYYLAESLFHLKNYAGAIKYYKILATRSPSRREEAQVRLMEIAVETNKFNLVDQFFRQREQFQNLSLRKKIVYLAAKSYYFRKNFPRAIELFNSIADDPKYGAKALFFLGTTALQVKPRAEGVKLALSYFQRALRRCPPDNPKLREFLLLTLGRLYLAMDNTTKALEYYLKIERRSKLFEEALYEVCWVYIKRAKKAKKRTVKEREYRRALQTLELLMSFLPDSPLYPQAQLLRAHLQLQIAALVNREERDSYYEMALKNYSAIAKQYRPIYRQMEQSIRERMKRGIDQKTLFRELIEQQLEEFTISSLLPKEALKWMSNEELMKRTFAVLKDLKMMKKYIRDSFQLLDKLDKIVELNQNDNKKLLLSPSLREAKMQADEVFSDILTIQNKINEIRKNIVLDKMAPADRERFLALEKRLKLIRSLFSQLPKNTKEFRKKDRAILKRLDSMRQRLHSVSLEIDYAVKLLNTLPKWFLYPEAKKLTPAQRNSIREDANDLEKMIQNLRQKYYQTKHELELAEISLRYASNDPYEDKIRRDYQQLLLQQNRLLQKISSKLSPSEQTTLDNLRQLENRLQTMRLELRNFLIIIQRFSDKYRQQLRRVIVEQRRNLQKYGQKIRGLVSEVKGLAAVIAYSSYHSVKRKFYNLILKAEVGVIDVVWSQHQNIQKEKNRLLKNRARDLKVLTEEYRGVSEELQTK